MVQKIYLWNLALDRVIKLSKKQTDFSEETETFIRTNHLIYWPE